jgi:O-antigen/teichoic acid export membrane protein
VKINVIANYFSQFFATIVGLVVIPYYIHILGKEAFGLIGFFGLVVVLFQLLDIGFSPTFAREVARFRGGEKNSCQLWNLFKFLCLFFLFTSVIGATIMYLLADYISKSWLKIEVLNLNDTILSIKIIGFVVAIKWFSGLFKALLQGFEKIVYLSVVNTIVVTLASIVVIPILMYIKASIQTYFIVQLISVVVELILLVSFSMKLMPANTPEINNISKVGEFRSVLKFAFGIAFTSSIWILVTQLDKLILSKVLPISEYGYFSLGVLAASGVNMVGGPIRQSVLPRLTKLYAENNQTQFLQLYRSATQVVSVVAFSVSAILAYFSTDILTLWVKDESIALKASFILQLYAVTNALLAVGSFPSLLQYAKGELRLHILGQLIFIIFYLPVMYYCVLHYGSMGAAWAWFGGNLLYLIVWIPITNAKVQPGINKQWFTKDVLLIFAPCFLINIVFKVIRDHLVLNRMELLLTIGIFSLLSLIISSLLSSYLRSYLILKFKLVFNLA